MSKNKDIRSFFTGGTFSKQTNGGEATGRGKEQNKKASKRRANNIDEDDDVIPETPPNKDKNNKRTRAVCYSSDEETNNFKSKNKNMKTSNSSKQSKKSPNKKSPSKPELKSVNIMDIFGKAPVKRVVDPSENKDSERSKKSKTELGIHDDENFDKTLMDLDNSDGATKSKSDTTKHNGKELTTPIKDNINCKRTRSGSRTPQNSKDDSTKDSSSSKKKSKNTENNHDSKSARSNSKSPHKSRRDSSKNNKESPKVHDRISSRTRSSSRTPQKHDNHSSSKSPIKSVPKFNLEDSKKQSKNDKRSDRDSKTNDKTNKDSKPSDRSKDRDSKRNDGDDKSKSSSNSPSKKVQSIKTSSRTSALDKKLAISEKVHGKKDFSMFINDVSNSSDTIILDDTIISSPQKDTQPDLNTTVTPKSETKSKKRKTLDTSTSELTDEERHERRRHSAVFYKNYMNRSGPKNPGSKEVPEGAPDCLAGLVFVVTGVQESFEKEEIEEIIKKFGGDVKKTMTKKVTHLIYGEDSGPKKMSQAEEMGTTLLTEDEFLQLIKDNTENRPSKGIVPVKKEPSSEKKRKPSPKKVSKKDEGLKFIKKEKEVMKEPENVEIEEDLTSDAKVSEPVKTDSGASIASVSSLSASSADKDIPWVEKYKPQALKNIIGQQGENSCAKKLLKWLSEWYANRQKNLPKPNPWAGDKNGGGYYKAALLSGPPGVGKTTTVALVCKELGFDTVEFNASDTRSKSLLKEQLTDLVSSNSLAGFCHGKAGKGAVSKKHVVIMDEVDGMAGNEDRGGMQELLSLIRSTSVPIICMCNDKTSLKMRSLSSNCYDLSFPRPNVKQIQGAMLSVCAKEGVKIPAPALAQMIVAANQDIRQILNLLSVWSAADKVLSEAGVDKDSKQAQKDMKMGPWEVVRKVFSLEEHKKMSIHDKSDLFFHDYSLGPLFVQQNYLKVAPKCEKKEVLERFAEAADCISLGDAVESKIRSNMAWSLLPLQAMFSSVIPGTVLAGHMTGQIEFPSWLGQNSRTNKMNRLAQELHSHTGLSTSGSKLSIRLDYARHLRDAVINPLIKEGSDGVRESIQILEDYHLLREDLDSLLELTHWPGQRDPYSMVETKVKTALTRTYNKEAAPLPYSQISMKKSKSTVSSADSEMFSSESTVPDIVEEEEVEEDSDVEHDAMIKAKVSKASSRDMKKASTSSATSTKNDSKKKNKGKK